MLRKNCGGGRRFLSWNTMNVRVLSIFLINCAETEKWNFIFRFLCHVIDIKYLVVHALLCSGFGERFLPQIKFSNRPFFSRSFLPIGSRDRLIGYTKVDVSDQTDSTIIYNTNILILYGYTVRGILYNKWSLKYCTVMRIRIGSWG